MAERQNLFWNLVLRPDPDWYEYEAPESFHVSMACVEPQSASGGATSIYLDKDGEEFLLCNLSSKQNNVSLDLNFGCGEKVCFRSSGQGTVHLTGYVHPDESSQMSWDSGSEDDEEEEEEAMPDLVKANSKKSKSDKDSSLGEDDLKAAVKKAKKMQAKVAQQSKKVPDDAKPESDSEDDSDDDDDDDDEDGSDEGDEDDSDDDGEDEEDSDDDEDESDDDDEDEEKTRMDTSAGSTPFKKIKKEIKQENGVASAKKDNKPKENSTPKKQKDQETPKKKPNGPMGPMKGDKTPKKEANGTPAKPDKKGEAATPMKGDKTPKKEKDGKGNNTPKPGKTPKKVIKGGIVVEDLSAGNGPEAKRGKMVGMYYEGRLKSNNMAYGDKGAAPEIPPKAMLVFDLECKYVN